MRGGQEVNRKLNELTETIRKKKKTEYNVQVGVGHCRTLVEQLRNNFPHLNF